jgi:hypothetical protein
MSGKGFHVHGPHEHEMKHVIEKVHADTMTNQIAMFTAIIATIGAFYGYMDGTTQANAVIYKNNASIKKTEAANQWNFYQAKSTKQSLSEIALSLGANSKTKNFADEIERYKLEKSEIKIVADKLEAVSEDWNRQSDREMRKHHRWAQATTLLQVTIALAAISLLSRKEWLKKIMYVVGVAGISLGIITALTV